MMVQQAVQFLGIVKVGIDGVLVWGRLHKFGIIGFRNIIFGNICAGVGKREHFFFGYANQFHIFAVHSPPAPVHVTCVCWVKGFIGCATDSYYWAHVSAKYKY